MPEPANKAAEGTRRDRGGRLLPGSTANPGGRPKVWREFQDAMRERSPLAVARIDEALASDDPQIVTWAVDKVLAYAWGRPPQRLQVGGDEDAPPVALEHGLDLARLSPEQLRTLLDIAAALRAPDAGG